MSGMPFLFGNFNDGYVDVLGRKNVGLFTVERASQSKRLKQRNLITSALGLVAFYRRPTLRLSDAIVHVTKRR